MDYYLKTDITLDGEVGRKMCGKSIKTYTNESTNQLTINK